MRRGMELRITNSFSGQTCAISDFDFIGSCILGMEREIVGIVK